MHAKLTGISMARLALLLYLFACLLHACRPFDKAKSQKDEPRPGADRRYPGVRLPASIGGADNMTNQLATAGVESDVDAKTGRLKAALVLRLDYFPDAKPGQTTLPVCYDVFPERFDLGLLECLDQEGLNVPLYAENVVQECYTKAALSQGQAARTAAKILPVLPGCKKARARLRVFEPALRLDVEARDLAP